MTLFLDDQDFMEGMWEAAPKTKDGRVQYVDEDVENLWRGGFINTENIDLDNWMKIMSKYKQPDEIYLLDHDQFVAMDDHRYKGEVKIPFNPMLINEGQYTEEDVDNLIKLSVLPSCGLDPEQIEFIINKYKSDFKMPNGLITMNESFKIKILALVETYPSPLRNLETMLDQIFTVAEKYLEEEGIDIDSIAKLAQQSMFTAKPTSATERKSAALKALTQAKKKQDAKPKLTKEEKKKSVKLSSIKRSKRGIKS